MIFLRLATAASLILLQLGLSGCSTRSGERLYLSTIDKDGGVVNYFRLIVEPHARLSNARYMSGFFDERAVDLFLNEYKISSDDMGSIRPFFPTDLCPAGTADADCKKTMDERLRLVPVGGAPTDESRRLVMILSSNAGPIAQTIGSFAKNEDVLKSLMFLSNREPLRKAALAQATGKLDTANRKNIFALIEAARVGAADATTKAGREQNYLLILQTAASEIGAKADFTTLDEASGVFNGKAPQ